MMAGNQWMAQSLPLSGVPPLRCSVMVAAPVEVGDDGEPQTPHTYTRCVHLATIARLAPLDDGSNDFRLQAFCTKCWESYQRAFEHGWLERTETL